MIEEDRTKTFVIRVYNERSGEPWSIDEVPDGIYRIYVHDVFKFLGKCGRILVLEEKERENPDPKVDAHVITENGYD